MTVDAATKVGLADKVGDGVHVGLNVGGGAIVTGAGEVQFVLISQSVL